MTRWMVTGAAALVIGMMIGLAARAPVRGAEGGHTGAVYREAGGNVLTADSGGTIGVESGGTLNAKSGSTVTLAGTNTLSGATTISGAATMSGGWTLPSGQTGTVASGATLSGAAGSTATLAGTNTLSGNTTVSAATLAVASGATLQAQSGSTTTLAGTNAISGVTTVTGATTFSTGSAPTVASGVTHTIQSGGTFTAASGSTANFNGTTAFGANGTSAFAYLHQVTTPITSTAIDYALLVAESGATVIETGNDKTLTLPTPAAGLRYILISLGAGGSVGTTIHPSGTAKVYGNGFTAGNSKGAINTHATAKAGDMMILISDGTDWYVIGVVGTWARES